MRSFLVALAIAVTCVACTRGSHPVSTKTQPLYDIVLENRHDSVVTGLVRFGTYDTVAGGRMRPNEIGGVHQDLAGGIPEKASVDMAVFPKGTTDFQHTPWMNHVSEVAVRSQLPKDFYDGVFYFIIQQDLSLRLVVLTHEQWVAMQAQGKRPN